MKETKGAPKECYLITGCVHADYDYSELDDSEISWAPFKTEKGDIGPYVLDLDNRVANLRRGNTVLIEAVMKLVSEYLFVTKGGMLIPSFISADDFALDVLVDAGYASINKSHNAFELHWDLLEERKKEL